MQQSVYFPLIKRVDVDNYQLYPGMSAERGLHQPFPPGVNVIVGVNGLGKTTLLRIILRLLTGARDLRVGDELGGAQRELSRSIDVNEFARRVPDQAVNATATLVFELGGREVTIKRSLKDLRLLSFDAIPKDPALPADSDLEVAYQLSVVQLSGLIDFFDFVFLLRHVVFFLEDRRGLVWDRWAQTELLRMLFLTSDFQREYRAALSEALSADSAARNTHAVLTRERKRLSKLLTAASQNPAAELDLLGVAVAQMSAQLDDIEPRIDKLDESRREQRRLAEARRHDASVLAQRERSLREGLLSTLFPKLSEGVDENNISCVML